MSHKEYTTFSSEQHKVPVLKDKADLLYELEEQAKAKFLEHDHRMRRLLKSAYRCNKPRVFDSIVFRIELMLKNYALEAMRNPDPFRPYCPLDLCGQGKMYLMDQIDGQKIYIDPNWLLTGLGLWGIQQSGKSRMIVHIISEFRRICPDVKITVIDPKGAFGYLAEFNHLSTENISFDLTPPDTISLERFAYELMPILANSIGLVFGLTILNQALDMVLKQREEYIQKTGIDPGLCVKDIQQTISSIKVSGFRQNGYKDGAETGSTLVIGKGKLFSCRKGVSLDWLFSQNTVLNARNLTHDTQCKFLATFLLYWLYQQTRFAPETNEIKHIIIIDDAVRFIGASTTEYEGKTKTSPLGNLLATLRASGVCLVYASQLPAMIDPAVLSLTPSVVAIGGITGTDNQRIIQSKMGLNNEQKDQIPRLRQREISAIINGSAWPYPIHGFSPEVDLNQYMTNRPVRPIIEIKSWHPLYQIPDYLLNTSSVPASISPKITEVNTAGDKNSCTEFPVLNPDAKKFLLDCITYPYDVVRDRIKRLGLSVRAYDSFKAELIQSGFLLPSSCGKSIYMIPTQKAYDVNGFHSPYKRSTSVEHSFYVNMTEYFLKQAGFKVNREVTVGTKGQTIDVVATNNSGQMTAFEVTLNISNLLSNAAKMQDTVYEKIVWLCRDGDTVKATNAYFNKTTSLPPELSNKFEYAFFGKWIKKMNNRKR